MEGRKEGEGTTGEWAGRRKKQRRKGKERKKKKKNKGKMRTRAGRRQKGGEQIGGRREARDGERKDEWSLKDQSARWRQRYFWRSSLNQSGSLYCPPVLQEAGRASSALLTEGSVARAAVSLAGVNPVDTGSDNAGNKTECEEAEEVG